MDAAINRAAAHGVPICLSFLTAIRDTADAVEIAGQAPTAATCSGITRERARVELVTYSRYARKQRRLQEAYMREVGRRLAKRMAQYPDIVVAASGDGEVELALRRRRCRSSPAPRRDGAAAVLADYSPFTIAEFRDWLRQGGLYAPGQPFAGEPGSAAAAMRATRLRGRTRTATGTR